MHEEVLTSVSEIDKTRKLYFDDEHLAKQARDKEEKYAIPLSSILSNICMTKELRSERPVCFLR